MFKNPIDKNEVRKLKRNLKSMALKKAMRTGSKDEDGRVRKDADRNRDD